ncbi:MAG TPA: LacI family transcriptional regulator [Anaerolineae bacterium]|nr:LacI family transcriptional regulator [Anaerolineae bacterium]
MAVTIKDVAERAGVAPSTVSRALNNRGRVSPETRERVLRAARELGYRPAMAGRGLALGRTENLGFLIHHRQSLDPGSFYGEVLAGVDSEARAHGFHVLFSADVSENLPAMVKERRVDGLILAGCDIPRDLIVALKARGVPLVLVDNHLDEVDSVVTDNIGGAREAVAHLIRLGHEKIGFICEWFGDLSFAERFEGYKLALQEHGLPFDESLTAEGLPRQPESGYVAMKRLLEKAVPSAVFAANDMTAAEAIRVIKERGLKVPEDIAVVGFDDGSLAPHTEPPLTTMRVFRERMGIMAARRLLELIEEPDQPPVQIKLATQLIVRGSCGANN